jgi:hypothetical protein
LYSNATIVVNADTTGLSTPLGIVDGGTGATTASGALVNLGGGTVGIPVFQSNTTASALSLLGAPSTLDAVSYSLIFS